MLKTTFTILFEGTDMPVSSFQYRSDSNGSSGSCVVEGLDYRDFISDNPEGEIVLTKHVGSTDTEILTCTIGTANIAKGPTDRSISIDFEDIVFSGSIPDSFAVDDLTSNEQLQSGYWSFLLPSIEQGYQNGMTVTYDDVERYILSVAVSWNADSFGSVTLTEGARPPDDESEAGDPGWPVCTTGPLTIGSISSGSFRTNCGSGLDSSDTYISPEGYTYDTYVFRCRYFELSSERQVKVEFSALPPALDTDNIASGFEFDLIQGVYEPFENPAPTINTTRGNGDFIATLPAGIYTCRVTVYVNRLSDPLAWLNSRYTLYVHYLD